MLVDKIKKLLFIKLFKTNNFYFNEIDFKLII